MKPIEKYRTEFEDALRSDPRFNYSENEFYKWLVDFGLKEAAIEELTRIFKEELGFGVHLNEQDGVTGAELEGWTRGGVDMIMWIHPFTPEEFVRIAGSFDVDEQIDLHRQAADYRSAFTCRRSVEDFEEWERRLKDNVGTLKKLGLFMKAACRECGGIMDAGDRRVWRCADIVHPDSRTDLLCPCCGGDADVIENQTKTKRTMDRKTGVVIGRPVGGISLNGLEYALDEHGDYMHFPSIDDAKRFLRESGVDGGEELEDCFMYKHHAFCPQCGGEHFIDPSDLREDESGGRSLCEKCESPLYVSHNDQ